MKTMDNIVLNRRQMVALGLGASAAFGLAACSSGESVEDTTADEVAEEAAEDEGADEAEVSTEATTLDADAYDALISSGTVADAAAIEASTWATKVKEAGTLRVGGTETSTLFSLRNTEDDSIRGFDSGLYQLLAKYILDDETAYDLTLVQSSTRESVLQNDTVDAVFATYTITDERAKVISFAGPYYVGHQGILVMADNTDINDVKDLDGKTVGVQTGSTGREVVEEFAPKATVQELGTDEELRQALEAGRIDAYVVDATLHMGSIVANPGKYRLASEFGPEDPLGIGLPLDSDGVAFVNDFLTSLEDDGTWEALWKICIGDRVGLDEAPEPPTPAATDETSDEDQDAEETD